MAYDWTKSDMQESPRLPLGQDIQVEITRLVFGKKGERFKTQNGDPKVMIVMADDQGRECSTMVTLSESAGWTLRTILAATDINREKMKAAGVAITDFAKEDFAKGNLIGRRLMIRVKEYLKDDGNLAEIAPLRRRPGTELPPTQTAPEPTAAPAAPPAPPPVKSDEIPF